MQTAGQTDKNNHAQKDKLREREIGEGDKQSYIVRKRKNGC